MASQGETSITTLVTPAGAWDTHIHVFEPERFPYSPDRAYTPRPAHLARYPHATTGCTNILVVQATVQGATADPLADLLERNVRSELGPGGGSSSSSSSSSINKLRALVDLDLASTSDDELDRLHDLGVRGMRMHFVSWGFGQQVSNHAAAEKLRYAVSRLRRLNWVISLYTHPRSWADLAPVIEGLFLPSTPSSTLSSTAPAADNTADHQYQQGGGGGGGDPVIIADHYGAFRPEHMGSPELEAFLGLVQRGRIYVKLSAFDRQYAGLEGGMETMEVLTRAVVEAAVEAAAAKGKQRGGERVGVRLLYASDWPNTALASSRDGKTKEERLADSEEPRVVDHALHLKFLREWIRDDDVWEDMFVRTPEKLFS